MKWFKLKWFKVMMLMTVIVLVFTVSSSVSSTSKKAEGGTSSVVVQANDTKANTCLPGDAVASHPTAKPKIELQYMGYTPCNPMVGDTLTFKYKLTAHPFEHFEKQEIVLVLDMSGSMNTEVGEGNSEKKLTEAKRAMVEFVNEMKSLPNVDIALVTYNISARVAVPFVSMSNDITNGENNDYQDLITYINKLGNSGEDKYKTADGTNIGDAMRIATALLNGSEYPDANKILISMTDGQPTNWTSKEWKEREGTKHNVSGSRDKYASQGPDNPVYYVNYKYTERINEIYAHSAKKTESDNPPYYAGNPRQTSNGNSNEGNNIKNNVNIARDYAIRIGEEISKIEGNPMTLYTIGYALGNNSANLKAIHDATKSPEENFITGGDISGIYKDLAATIKNDYSFDDAKININIPGGLTAGSGIDDNQSVNFDSIEYTIDREHWIYNADPAEQYIEFQVHANEAGEYVVLGSVPTFTYKDVTGEDITVDLGSVNVDIKVDPYDPNKAGKLEGSLTTETGYLVGDTVEAVTTLTNRIREADTIFKDIKFVLGTLPKEVTWLNESNSTLTFGDVTIESDKTIIGLQRLKVADDQAIQDAPVDVTLNGDYSYKIAHTNNSNVTPVAEPKTTTFKAKRGRIQAIIEHDDSTMDLSEVITNFKIYLEDEAGTRTEGTYNELTNKYDFNVIQPSGEYSVYLERLPLGLQPTSAIKQSTILNYNNASQTLEFSVTGTPEASLPNIIPTLESELAVELDVNTDTILEYKLDPKPFNYSGPITHQAVDVAVVLDTTLGNKEILKNIKSTLQKTLVEDLSTQQVRYGLVTFDTERRTNIELSEADEFKFEFNMNNTSQTAGKLNKAYEFINNQLGNNANNHKDIIIIISDNNVDVGNFNEITNKGYQPFVINVGALNESDTLKNLNTSLGGNDSTYFTEIQSALETIKRLITNQTYKDITVQPSLTFKLPDGVQLKEETDQCQQQETSIISCTTNMTYHYTANDEGIYEYSSEVQNISFTLTPETYGLKVFDGKGQMSYMGFQSNSTSLDMSINKSVDTPLLSVEGSSIINEQGFYTNDLTDASIEDNHLIHSFTQIESKPFPEEYEFMPIVEEMNYYYASMMTIKSLEASLEISMTYPDGVSLVTQSELNESKFKQPVIYKLDEHGKFDFNTPISFTSIVNEKNGYKLIFEPTEDLKLEQGSTYIAIYPGILDVSNELVLTDKTDLTVTIATKIIDSVTMSDNKVEAVSGGKIQVQTFKDKNEVEQTETKLPNLF